MTEWDEFKTYNWQKAYNNMQKPAVLFYKQIIPDAKALTEIGFEYTKALGKAGREGK
jgi:UDPglucose 6-dehydrogenase